LAFSRRLGTRVTWRPETSRGMPVNIQFLNPKHPLHSKRYYDTHSRVQAEREHLMYIYRIIIIHGTTEQKTRWQNPRKSRTAWVLSNAWSQKDDSKHHLLQTPRRQRQSYNIFSMSVLEGLGGRGKYTPVTFDLRQELLLHHLKITKPQLGEPLMACNGCPYPMMVMFSPIRSFIPTRTHM